MREDSLAQRQHICHMHWCVLPWAPSRPILLFSKPRCRNDAFRATSSQTCLVPASASSQVMQVAPRQGRQIALQMASRAAQNIITSSLHHACPRSSWTNGGSPWCSGHALAVAAANALLAKHGFGVEAQT